MLMFVSGVLFTIGSIVYGKGMYELGRIEERKENRKKILTDIYNEVFKKTKD